MNEQIRDMRLKRIGMKIQQIVSLSDALFVLSTNLVRFRFIRVV
nr:MAG TPA: hypothetical protein [Caudoviricetes sp.]